MSGSGANRIDPRYCCLAVPIVNAGIYLIQLEQIAVGFAAGILCFVAPSIVGAETPDFVSYILGIICFLGVAIQPVGFFGVFREKTTTFRWYALLNLILSAFAFIVGAVIVIVSAIKHNSAESKCQRTFYTAETGASALTNNSLTTESGVLCNAFAWADIGLMGGLWVVLFVVQLYFNFAIRSYSKVQINDHKLYHSVYSENPEAFTMSILQSKRYNGPESVYWQNAAPRGDAWDHRPSFDTPHEPGPESGGGYYGHQQYSDDPAYARGYEDLAPPGNNPYAASPAPHGAGGVDYAFNAPGGGYVDPNVAPSYPHTAPPPTRG